eukprot:6990380-Pyramimonas_sp.AAC.1
MYPPSRPTVPPFTSCCTTPLTSYRTPLAFYRTLLTSFRTPLCVGEGEGARARALPSASEGPLRAQA